MIKLIKTVGGCGGSPSQCEKCKGNNFIKSGIAWSCADCGSYFPVKLDSTKGLRENLKTLKALHSRLIGLHNELTELVKD